MTDEQRQQIKMLPYQGYGYKQIASEVVDYLENRLGVIVYGMVAWIWNKPG